MVAPPEHLLLTHAIRGDPLSEIPPSIRWTSLSKTLFKEQLAPLFYEWLQGESDLKGQLPKDLLSDLQRTHLHTAAMNTRRREHLKKLLVRFNDARIPVILHKGVILSDEVYKSIAARPMIDVDLIVRDEDRQRVETIVRSADLPIIVDLHTDIVNTDRFRMVQKTPSLRMQTMWQHARPILFDGIPALALSAEDQLIALSIHLAFNHRFEGLLWFVDLIRLLKTFEAVFNWELMIQNARGYDSSRSVYYCLKYLKEKFDTAIPDEVLAALKPSRQGLLEKRLLKRVWEEKPVGRLGYFLSLPLLEDRALRRRYFWWTVLANRYFKIGRGFKSH